MKVHVVNVELTEEEFKNLNQTSITLANLRERLIQLKWDSISLNNEKWSITEIETVVTMLTDLQEECSIED